MLPDTQSRKPLFSIVSRPSIIMKPQNLIYTIHADTTKKVFAPICVLGIP